jgi:hypothetical protein
MGITYAEAEVGNEAGMMQKVRFLVDSGAAYSVLPLTLRPARLKLSAVGPPAASA